jgi:hypothetical protein
MGEQKRPPRQRGKKSRAWLGWVLVIAALAGAGYWYWPRFKERYSYPAGGPMEAVGLNAICSANVSYQYMHPKQGYAKTLQELGPKGGNYIDSPLASGQKGGYRFEYLAQVGPEGRIEEYRVTARPLRYGEDGKTSYYSDENCVVHFTREDRAATAADPPLQ